MARCRWVLLRTFFSSRAREGETVLERTRTVNMEDGRADKERGKEGRNRGSLDRRRSSQLEESMDLVHAHIVNRLKELIGQLHEIRNTDITFPTLGTGRTLESVENRKNALAEDLLWLLEDAETVAPELPTFYLRAKMVSIEGWIRNIQTIVEGAIQVFERANGNEFDRRRSSLITLANESGVDENISLSEFRATVQTHALLQQVKKHNIKKKGAELDAELDKVKSSSKNVELILDSLRSKLKDRAYQETLESFTKISQRHRFHSSCWFWSLIAFTLVLLGVVITVVFFPSHIESLKLEPGVNTISGILRQSLLIGAALLLVRVCLTKYNAERHLRIVYDHRRAALEQLKLFEAAIQDPATLASIRLEAVKMLLSDPATAYASRSDVTELNVSPIFTAIEKVSSAATGKAP
jgi:hypothetical protein